MTQDDREHHAAQLAKEAIGSTGPEVRPDLAGSDDVAPAGDEHRSEAAENPEGAQRGRRREPDATGVRPGTGQSTGGDTGQEAAPVSEPG